MPLIWREEMFRKGKFPPKKWLNIAITGEERGNTGKVRS